MHYIGMICTNGGQDARPTEGLSHRGLMIGLIINSD
jgi:hypothetical protein